jgi:hypothetical protein
MRGVRVLLVTMLAVAPGLVVMPGLVVAQTVGGQQNNQPSANQNQSQMQTDNNQQPGEVKVLPPTQSSQTAPNPMPQMSK